MVEIEDAKDLLEQAGLDTVTLFADRRDGYADWCHNIRYPPGREAAHKAISYAVARSAKSSPWPRWWTDSAEPILYSLPDEGSLVGKRQQLVENFTAHMVPAGMDRFTAAGMAATWWEESFVELQTAASRGWKAVIEAWLTTAEASQEGKKPPDLAAQLGIQILAAPELANRSQLAAEHAHLDTQIKAADDNLLTSAEIRELKAARTKVKRLSRSIDADLIPIARQALEAVSPADAPAKVIAELRSRIEKLVRDHFGTIERNALAWYDNLANKYGTTLRQIETDRDIAAARLEKHLGELGYA